MHTPVFLEIRAHLGHPVNNVINDIRSHAGHRRPMLDKLKNWFRPRPGVSGSAARADMVHSDDHRSPRPVAHKRKIPRPAPEFVEADENLTDRIDSTGPGKNVLIRNRFVREDTGTHETLKILDDSMVDSGEESGIDPYNTGGFDRSRNWDKRFGK